MIDIQAEKILELPAGTHHFRLSKGFRYVFLVTGENGGPTNILYKNHYTDVSGVAPDFFESGQAFGAAVPGLFQGVLEIVLAGPETISFVRQTFIS